MCGDRPSDAELLREQAELDEVRRVFLTHPRDADAPTLIKQREFAGLTLDKAAALAKISRFRLAEYERGDAKPSPEVCERLQAVYGCGGSSGANSNPAA